MTHHGESVEEGEARTPQSGPAEGRNLAAAGPLAEDPTTRQDMASHPGKIHIGGTMFRAAHPTDRRRSRSRLSTACLSLALLLLGAPSLSGQDTYRIGVTLGGTSSIGLSFEMLWGDAAVDLSLGTWAFRDFSASVVGKYYAGAESFKGYGGAGLWFITAFPQEEDERTGFATVLRIPVGLEGIIDHQHALGLEVNLDRALSVRRPDPTDDLPPNERFVPLPGLYYRYGDREDPP